MIIVTGTILTNHYLLQEQQQTWLPRMETLLCTRLWAKCFLHFISLHSHSEESIILLNLQMKKLRLRDFKEPVQDHK